MALTANQLLGKWLGYAITVRIFDGKKFATQSTADGGFIPRGRGITKNADFVREAGVLDADLDTLEPSDDYGTAQPLTFTTPDGYSKVVKSGTNVYYPTSLLDTNPSLTTGATTTTTGGRSADTALSKAWAWVQANPLQAAVIGFIVYVVIIEPLVLKKKGKKSLLGKLF